MTKKAVEDVSESGKSLPTSVARFAEGISERISVAVEKLGGNAKAGEVAGVTDEQIRRWRSGRNKPSLFGLLALSVESEVPFTWLATGESPSDSRPLPSHVPVRTEQEQGELPMQMVDPRSLEEGAFVVLPLMDISAAAGSGRLSPDFPMIRSQVALSEDYLRSIGVQPRFAQLLEIDGDSMFPTLKDRDIAVVDTSILDVRSSAVYAVIYGGLVVAKRVQINRDGSILLSSDNKAAGYQDERVAPGDLQDLHIAGRIKGRLGGL